MPKLSNQKCLVFIMVRIKQPYYNLHQIDTGRYTSGNEFVIGTGELYIGAYHILPNNQKFSGFQPEPKSQELFELRLNPTQDILRYNQISGNKINAYSVPISYSPIPSAEDYKLGFIQRYLIQKRNSPQNSIIEIDGIQFNQINTQSKPGINGIIYNKQKVKWIISKIPMNDASYLNERELIKVSNDFPFIGTYLTNLLEFYK